MKKPMAIIEAYFAETNLESFEVDPAKQHAENIVLALFKGGYCIIARRDAAILPALYDALQQLGNIENATALIAIPEDGKCE